MHFATLIPDWNSLDSVRRAHSDLEATALVFFALLVFFDILAHLSTKDRKKALLEKIGLCCFTIAVLAESVAYPYGQRNDALSERVIGSLDAKAEEADNKAKTAITDSSTALSQAKDADDKSKDAVMKAGTAEASLGKAEVEANKADTSALDALTTAREARKEADSFEQGIASAEKKAAAAESQITDAVKQANDAIAELNRLKTPRSLGNIPALIATVKDFGGTEYTFWGVFGDQESTSLASQISDALQSAGWKPVPSPNVGFGGAEYFNLNHFPPEYVRPSIATGVRIQVEAEGKKAEDIAALPPSQWPRQVQAGRALKLALGASIWPPQRDLTTSALDIAGKGELRMGQLGKIVLIEVGKKP